MHPISVMIKPASSSCNLKCRYCFYADEASLRSVPNYGVMSEAVLEKTIALFLQSAVGCCSFAFQGGEPTLAGLSFFERVVSLQKMYARSDLKITNALQTNGVLLDEQWCHFLSENHFLVGLSLDGTKETHDLYRLRQNGKGSYSAVLHAAQLMKSHGVEFNILTVVTSQSAHNVTKIYNFYKRNNWLYQQYIPCMDALQDARGTQCYSLSPTDYAEFLKKLFDLWYTDLTNGFAVSIRYFDNLLQILQGFPPESCAMTGHCNIQYLVESDGSVFPCDFYAMDDFRLGNTLFDSVDAMDEKRRSIRFIETSIDYTKHCKDCPWHFLCRGGCRRDYLQTLQPQNYYCESYKIFFAYAYPRLKHAAEIIQRFRLINRDY